MRKFMIGAAMLLFATAVIGHEGHDGKQSLPPVGPHGGKFVKMKNHFAELVVRGDVAVIYVLEDDIKSAPEQLTDVTAALEIPGKGTTRLHLSSVDGGFQASISIPKGTRRAYFHVSAKVDGKMETGKILYEPK